MRKKIITPSSKTLLAAKPMIIFKSADDTGEKWIAVPPNEVPFWLRSDMDAMAKLMDGYGAQAPNETVTYIAIDPDIAVQAAMIEAANRNALIYSEAVNDE